MPKIDKKFKDQSKFARIGVASSASIYEPNLRNEFFSWLYEYIDDSQWVMVTEPNKRRFTVYKRSLYIFQTR
jgi:hypothetical protein